MKAAVSVRADAPTLTRARAADYLELTKPRVAVLVLFSVAIGALLAAGRDIDLVLLFHTVLGTALVAGGASALNQLLERQTDAHMARTANRPLPAGRLSPVEVLTFGLALGVIGVVYLALALPRPTAAVVAAVTFVLYVAVYTPLKPITTANTLVGAVPGALPPVIGWCGVRGELSADALALFLIVFVWQIPHFLAIAWMYREQYGRAGLKMLPVVDPDGRLTAHQMTAYCLVLLPASLGPALLGNAGLLYVVGALAVGGMFLTSVLRFGRERSRDQARRVLKASLLYLPVVLALLLVDRWTLS